MKRCLQMVGAGLVAFVLLAPSSFAQQNETPAVAVLASDGVKHAPPVSQVAKWLRQTAQELHVADRELPHVMVIYVDTRAGAVEYLPAQAMLLVEESTTSKLPLYYVWLVDDNGADATIQGLVAVLNRKFNLQLNRGGIVAASERISRRAHATVNVRELFR